MIRKLSSLIIALAAALLFSQDVLAQANSYPPTASATLRGLVKSDGGVTTAIAADGTITAVGSAASTIDAGGATSVTNGTNGDVLTQAAGKVSHSTLVSGSNGIVVSGTTISQTNAANTQSGTTYAPSDCSALAQKTTVLTATSAVTVTLPNVSQTACGAGATLSFASGGSTPSQVTINVTSPSLINGAASYTLAAGQAILLADPDGLNYAAIESTPPLASGHIFIGQTGSLAADTAVTGDVTITAGGVTAIGTNKVTTTTINAGAVTEAKITVADNTTDNVSTSAHGFAPKAPNDATKYLDGTGAYTVPAGGAGGGITAYSDNGVTLTAGTYYAPIGGGGIPQATEGNVDVKAAAAGTIANLQVELSADPGTGQTLAVTLRDAAADKAVTCTITGSGGGTNTACQDLTHSFNVAQNDLIDWKIVTTGTYVATPTITIHATWGTSNVGVTSVVCGTGLTGGTITTTGTCALSTPVSAANGGTGQSSYAVGDIPYASASTTISKLADVATGQVLHSGGVGAAPAYSAIATGDLPATAFATGTSVSLTAPRQYYVCTGTCTVTPPVPAAGYEFCVMNDDNVATVITLAALGSSARYEATARTSYGTAGTGTFVSGGAAKDQVCIVGRDSTHYLTVSSTGTWTAN